MNRFTQLVQAINDLDTNDPRAERVIALLDEITEDSSDTFEAARTLLDGPSGPLWMQTCSGPQVARVAEQNLLILGPEHAITPEDGWHEEFTKQTIEVLVVSPKADEDDNWFPPDDDSGEW